MSVTSFRDLRVWQGGVDLVVCIYRLTRAFPKHELYGLAGQMQRAAVSIPSNIAEGHTRSHSKEYLQHLCIAQASLAELQTQIEIAARLQYCTQMEYDQLSQQAAGISRQLYALHNAVSKRQDR